MILPNSDVRIRHSRLSVLAVMGLLLVASSRLLAQDAGDLRQTPAADAVVESARNFGIRLADREAERKLQEGLEKGDYATDRGLKDYYEIFSRETAFGPKSLLKSEMERLDRDAVWIDAGAGTGNAAFDFMCDARRRGKRPSVIAVTIESHPNWKSKAGSKCKWSQDDYARFQFLTGPGIEDYAVGGPAADGAPALPEGKADLITDYFGAAAYARQLDRVVLQFGKLLKPGGKAFIYGVLPRVLYQGQPRFTSIRRPGREGDALMDWFHAIGGMTVSIRKSDTDVFFVLQRTSAPLSVPPLELESIDDFGPPARDYIWK